MHKFSLKNFLKFWDPSETSTLLNNDFVLIQAEHVFSTYMQTCRIKLRKLYWWLQQQFFDVIGDCTTLWDWLWLWNVRIHVEKVQWTTVKVSIIIVMAYVALTETNVSSFITFVLSGGERKCTSCIIYYDASV